jgi:probable selenium-dependent hydroxylase accessory protein YqeC
MSQYFSAVDLLGLRDGTPDNPSVVAVIGCGGKTSFIESLAWELRNKKVLITPTTKIMPMDADGVTLCKTWYECKKHRPASGIQCLGILNEKTGKLSSLPIEVLAEIVGGYDVVLLEADGSRGLPCKGWLDSEPVIPFFCTHTVGIVTLNALDKTADENTVLRLHEFLKLTGLRAGELILQQALTEMVCAPNGMFRSGVGKQYVFVNQVENDGIAEVAKHWLQKIKEQYPNRFFCLAYGSVHKNSWREV